MATVANNSDSGVTPPLPLDHPSLYLDREMSLLAFQRRVLGEARDPRNPLLERVKFLAILFSNIDEFFMVRVALLNQKVDSSKNDPAATEHLERIGNELRKLLGEAYAVWRELDLALSQAGVDIREYRNLTEKERDALDTYFHDVVYPVLTPLAFDPGHPFPHISNLSLNLAVIVKDLAGARKFARVKIPDTFPSLVAATADPTAPQTFVWLEQLIRANLQSLFPGLEIVEAHPFRVTRDAEYEIQELESDDLLETIEEAVWQRRFRDVVQMQVLQDIPRDLLDVLLENLELHQRDVYYVEGPLDLSRAKQLMSLDRPALKDHVFHPQIPRALRFKDGEDVFAAIRKHDILLHHPFDSFQPVPELLRHAATDPDVLAIKIMLYRVGRNSPIVEHLLTAVEHGKQVAVLVELKARFDEESNIEWARALESAGVHVVYGLVGLKVHSKVALIVRREGAHMRRYVHLGTGNYNAVTARLYTDLSLMTADEAIGADVTDLFNYVTAYSGKREFRKLLVAPRSLRPGIEALIRREIAFAQKGEPAYLIFKMNSLEDPAMIRLLYEASQAGVQVNLLVRGLCCLRPGIDGVSSNIRVISVVGRFLEHSRVYYFRNGGQEQIYLGSADLMGRNLDRRVEVLFPVENKGLIAKVRGDILGTYLADTRNAHYMQSDGSYRKPEAGASQLNSQAHFLSL
ncbi:MAG: polyphosphate kinase 1 [Bryobacteraceae bacterium]